jgi:hypothetical protein
MAKFHKEAALLYAEMNGIKIKNPDDEDAIVVAIKDWVGVQPDTCDCKSRIRDTDRMCWYCGGDVAPEGVDPGGYKRLLQERKYDAAAKKEIEEVEAEVTAAEEAREELSELEEEADEEAPREDSEEEPVETAAPKKAGGKKEKEKEKEKDIKAAKINLKVVSDPLPIEEKEQVKPAKRGEMTLERRVEEIKTLNKQTGVSAWKIGKHLFEIKSQALYKEQGIENFDEFCSKALNFSKQHAYNYLRIAEKFDQDEAKQIGLSHLIKLSTNSISDTDREKLFEKAPEMDFKDFEKEVQKVMDATAKEKGKEPKQRKVSSPFLNLVGSKVEGKYDKADPQKAYLQLDDMVHVELRVFKTKVAAEFKQIEV